MWKNKTKKTAYALKLLYGAFDSNEKAHRMSELSQEAYYNYDHDEAKEYSQKKEYFYWIKQNFIEKAIKYIKKYSLPIKYGENDWIFYFSYLWEQISFHSFSRKITNNYYKSYNGKWSCRKNEKFPRRMFYFIKKHLIK